MPISVAIASTYCDSILNEESQNQINNFRSDKKANGIGQDFFVRDGKTYHSAALITAKSEFGYASDHITRLARQGKVMAVNEIGKWFICEESLREYYKKAKENKKNGGLKAVGKFNAVLSDRLQEKTSGSGWSSFSGDDKVVLSSKPVDSGVSTVLSSLPVIDGQSADAGIRFPETKPSEFLSSGYAHRAVNRAIVLTALLFFSVAVFTFFNIKNNNGGLIKNLVKNNVNQASSQLTAGLAVLIAQLNGSTEINPLLSDYDANIQKVQTFLNQEEQKYQELVNRYSQPTFVQERTGGGVAESGGIISRVLSFQFSSSEASTLKDLARRITAGGVLVAQSIDSSNLRGLIDDLNSRLFQLTDRVDQIPPPLQYFGGGGGTTVITVGGGDSSLVGSSLTIGSTSIVSGGITTPSLTVSGTTKLNGITYGWPSADGSSGQLLRTDGSGTLSWITQAAGVTSNSIDFDEIVASASLDTNWDIALNGKNIDIGDGKFFINSSGNIGLGTSNLTTAFELVGGASISGTASISGDMVFYGEIRPDGAICSNGQILKKTGSNDWDCASDSTGSGGATIEVTEIGDSFNSSQISSVSFASNHFIISGSDPEAIIRLDWTNGPASRAFDETITGKWN
ncbi:MAG: hypothetical protein AAB784_02240, partial [Patescibacteria group bacterium]